MKMDLQLPSSDVVEVELDYEKLDKHCFLCKSLTHEKDDCPLRHDARYNVNEKTELGISQRNALERIAEGRRRQDDRRYACVTANSRQQREARWTNARPTNRLSGSNSSLSRDETRGSSEVDENRRRFDDRYLAGRRYVSRRSPHRSYQKEDSTRGSHDSSLPKETHVDNHQLAHSRGASSRSNHSLADPGSNLKRTNIASRLSDPRSDHGEGRSSALARLSLPQSEERRPSKERLSSNTQSEERLSARQDSRKELIVRNVPLLQNNVACAAIITRPSSSNFLEDNRLRPCDRSPIRTLSEDRVHVSLRLGPLFSEEEKEDEDIGDDIPQMMERAPSKAEGKRIAGSTQDHKRALRNNSHGVAVKRRRVTKKNSSPRGLSLSGRDDVQVEILYSSPNDRGTWHVLFRVIHIRSP
ncbi:hypothetical protein HID58_006562 [Brassica napus]|uniref:Zinc knuckle CX2CX4HX4C domain-containing protein n=1 Tax=Brassica napus TaxID=3708 RepID=A0ABQ8EBV2_BRANA|nr:hypothetical protein HID58_006562 [Brassica napus]